MNAWGRQFKNRHISQKEEPIYHSVSETVARRSDGSQVFVVAGGDEYPSSVSQADTLIYDVDLGVW